MLKKVSLLVFAVTVSALVHAQTADEVYNKYLDFNLARLQGEQSKGLSIGEQILPDSGKLPPKARLAFYNGIAKLYDDDNQTAKAIEFYQRVIAALPDYYIGHRALGYLYIKNIAVKPGDTAKVDAAYIAAARKALPHLEKAEACESDNATYIIIKTLYHNLNDTAGLNSLKARLKKLRGNCIDLVADN